MKMRCTKTIMHLVLTACLAACGGAEQGLSESGLIPTNDNTIASNAATEPSSSDSNQDQAASTNETPPAAITPLEEEPAEETNYNASISNVVLVRKGSEPEFETLFTVEDGVEIDINEIDAEALNIIAESGDLNEIGSLSFHLSGPLEIERIENEPDFTLADDLENILLDEIEALLGDYTLSITPFELDDAMGQQGDTYVINFSFVNSVVIPEISDLNLKAASAVNDYSDILEVTDGIAINLSDIGASQINITADIEGDTLPGSVHFELQGPLQLDRTENQYEFTMASGYENISLAEPEALVGDYVLSVTPYQLPDQDGVAGETKTVSFSFYTSEPTSTSELPEVVSIDLYALTDETEQWVKVRSLENEDVVDLTTLPSEKFNIFANVETSATELGSLSFNLAGPTALSRPENNAPYTLQDDTINFLTDGGLELGEYTLTLTPHEQAGGTGSQGTPYQISFTVVQNSASEPSSETSSETEVKAENDFYTVEEGAELNSNDTSGVSRNDLYDSESAIFEIANEATSGEVVMTLDGHFTYTPQDNFTGQDSFTYTISQNEETSSATVSINVHSSSSNSGFTPVVSSTDTRVIYVSSSSGSDDNDCLTSETACASIPGGINKTRNGYPDHLLLSRGDKWKDQCFISPPSGRSPSEPYVISFYGNSGDRPEILCAAKFFAASTQMKNVNIQGVTFNAYKLEETHEEFSGEAEDIANIVLLGANHNILFEDVIFNHVEMILQGYNGGNPENIRLLRNIWTGAYYPGSSSSRAKRPSNLFAHSVDGLLIEENVFDSGGWNPNVADSASNQYNHNMYIQHNTVGNNLVVRNNIITRASSHGVHGRPGGLFEDNFFARNAISLQMGYRNYPLGSNTFAHAFNNVITEGESMIRGDDPCSSSANLCTNAVWGLHVADANNASSVVLQGNIVAGISDNDEWQELYDRLKRVSISADGGDSNVEYSNNRVWSWDEDTQGTDSGFENPGLTLADYNESLGGDNSFDSFMNVVLNRPIGTWSEELSAKSINTFIRNGYAQ